MKKIKVLLIGLALMLVALTPLMFVGGGVNFASQAEEVVDEKPYITNIRTEEDLINLANDVNGVIKNGKVETEGRNYSGITVTLENDIVIESAWTPIGNDAFPFAGTFDGNGKRILNVRITDAFTYQGLFGVTSGATIKNLAISTALNTSFLAEGEVYAGGIVGKAINSNISGCEVDNDVNNSFITVTNPEYTISNKVTFGAIAGYLEGGSVKNCASYISATNVTLDLKNFYTVKIGGAFGLVVNANLEKIVSFGTIKCAHKLDSALGNLYVGGLVGEIDGEKTKIKDCVVGQTISVTKQEGNGYKLGSVAGNILSKPDKGNISSVAYLASYDSFSTLLPAFGEQGGYEYGDTTNQDYIMRATEAIYAQDFYLAERYAITVNGETKIFEWNKASSAWDFDNTWVMAQVEDEGQNVTSQIRLQRFQVFRIGPALVIDTQNLLTTSSQSQDYEFGDRPELRFTLAEDNVGYYQIDEIYRGGQPLNYAEFVPGDNGEMVSPDGAITLLQNGGEIILKVTASNLTQGYYSFRLVSVNYQTYIVAGENGGVRYSGTVNTSQELARTLTKGREISVEGVGNRTFAFSNWQLYYLDEEGEFEYADKKWSQESFTSKSNPFRIKFASPLEDGERNPFDREFLLVAIFESDPCTINFSFNTDLIQKVEINRSVITESGKGVELDKNESVSIKVYVKNTTQFDSAAFGDTIKALFTYNTAALRRTAQVDPLDKDTTIYEYAFLSSAINYQSTSNFNLSINAQAKENEGSSNTTVWIIVGVVGGVVLLAGIGITIWLVLRRRYSGGSDYKNYY